MMLNFQLHGNFSSQFPDKLGSIEDLGHSPINCCKFNRWGLLVAFGTIDGRILIFDTTAQTVVKYWNAHALTITSLSWSRYGRKLITAASDNSIVIWDVMSGTAVERIRAPSIVLSAIFNPRNDHQVLIVCNNCPPSVEDLRTKTNKVLTNEIPGSADDAIFAASWDRRGEYILTGSTKGKIIIYDSKTLRMVNWCKQTNLQQGDFVVTNANDRVIRTYTLTELLQAVKGAPMEALNKASDIVNRAAWKCVCTDRDGNYICGASLKSHSLYIWERSTGNLVKMLNGTKGETILDVQWHPTRPVIFSIANNFVSMWTATQIENWSAFAPEFTELEENVKYEETEGEFDIEDEDKSVKGKDEDDRSMDDSSCEEIDIEALTPNEALCSSDEEDALNSLKPPDPTMKTGPLWFLPPAETENPEEPLSFTDMNAIPQQNPAMMGNFVHRAPLPPPGGPGMLKLKKR